MTSTYTVSKHLSAYLRRFDQLKPRISTQPRWLGQLRQSAIGSFHESGFPAVHHEDWQFTDPAAFSEFEPTFPDTEKERPLETADITRLELFPMAGPHIVFVNGRFIPSLSRLDTHGPAAAVTLFGDGEPSRSPEPSDRFGQVAGLEDHPFTALNTALFTDGVFVRVPAGVNASSVIRLLFITTADLPGRTVFPRIFIHAEKGSEATVMEQYVTDGETASMTNAVTEVLVEEEGTLHHVKCHLESEKTLHVARVKAHVNQDGRFLSHSIALGGRVARHDLQAVLAGERSDCLMNGLYLGRNEQLIDHHTTIDHATPNGTSHEYYHGILSGRSRGVFNGKIFVRKVAQKTDAKQTNRVILLSDQARIDTKPQLEIFADDVKCTHGATVGQLDEESVFYLRSRGIPEPLARNMLVLAFAQSILNRLPNASIRDALDTLVFNRLTAAGGSQ